MRARNHRTPVSIWIIVALWTLVGLIQLTRLASTAPQDSLGGVVALILFGLAALTYQWIGLVRLSRWPILFQVASVIFSLVSRHLAHFDWRHRYPMLGPFIVLIPLAIYLACTLPHWRKMNWALFGRPYRQPEDQAGLAA